MFFAIFIRIIITEEPSTRDSARTRPLVFASKQLSAHRASQFCQIDAKIIMKRISKQKKYFSLQRLKLNRLEHQ